jgi:peptidyl-prolyl cis-trans isomerase SurA
VDRIVAVVNGEIITYDELQQQLRLILGRPRGDGGCQNGSAGSGQHDRRHHHPPGSGPAAVDVSIRNRQRNQQFKARHRMSEEDFQRTLRLQGLTVEQFRDAAVRKSSSTSSSMAWSGARSS